MTTKHEDVDKTVEFILDVDAVLETVTKAKSADSPGGAKIVATEWLTIGVSAAPRAVRTFRNLSELKDEALDLESEEGEEILNAFYEIYKPENPFIQGAVLKFLQGGLLIKEGGFELAQAKEWEKANK